MSILKGKKAVVTGASSGIGRGIALRFAKEGAEVALLARREARLKEVQKEIKDAGGRAHIFVCDLYKDNLIPKAFAQIRKTIGNIDILVNNAGAGYSGKEIPETTIEEFDLTFNLNIRALYLCTKEVLPGMIKNKEGAIINIGSIAGKMGLARSTIYCGSKFAVHGFSEALLEEVRPYNIKVSVIAPGMVHTEFFGRKRAPRGDLKDYIQPEDIADAAVLCASPSQTATFKEIVVRPRRPIK